MSLAEIERLFDTRAGDGKSGASPYEFVTNKFMHTTVEQEAVENGQKVKRQVLDVDARTELNSPIAFAAAETYQIYLGRIFAKKVPTWVQPNQDLLDIFHSRVKIDMINKNREGRHEAERILSAYFGAQKQVGLGEVQQAILNK